MATNFNVDPWYDDFDKSKGFHRILFNPTFAVQARELTQMQTMLQNQIEQFGSHIFKQGSMVLPGNSDVELGIQCIKIQPTHNSGIVDYSVFNEKVIVGQTSGIRAYVKKAIAATGTDPITFYLSYLSGGINSELTFLDGEVLIVEGQPSKACTTLATNSNAVGSIAFIKAGVFYVNGFFVYCHPQIEVISKYSATPSVHVLLKIVEETINASADESLLDPAQGSYNFAAPGADRFKVSLILTPLPLGTTINDNYIEIIRLEDGVITEHVRSPKYNELEKALATRTFEESGNYVVNGLGAKIREHRKKKLNGGVYDDGDDDKFVYNTSSGKAYFQGFPIEKLSGTMISANKARTSDHVKQTSTIIKPVYGQYFYVASATGNLDISNRETIQLWDISTDTGGTQLGTAKVLAIDYHTGDGVNPIYRLFVSDIQFTNGTYDEIGSIRSSSGNFFAKVVAEYDAPLNSGSFVVNDVVSYESSTRTATVSFYAPLTGKLYAHRHTTASSPKTGDLIIGPNAQTTIKAKKMVVTNGPSRCIFPMAQSATKALKNASNSFDLEYTHHVRLTIAAGNTTTATVSGTVVPLEVGTFIALSTAGSDSISNYSLNGTGTAIVRSSPAPVGGITIYAQVNVENATPRTKSPTSFVAIKTAASNVLLDHADVYELVSVVVGGVETFNMWTLDTGATDYEYGVSSIKLKDGYTLPSGTLSISYKYFNHTPGDYFTVDSYSGVPNQDIPNFTSSSTGQTYRLRDVIDFRKTYFSPSNIVVSDTIVTTSVQKYIGRIDSLCIAKDSKFIVISGTPAENPRAPKIPVDVYELSRFSIPAYTYSLGQILEKRIAVNRYTMTDIKKMDDRLSSLEEFSTLTAAEAAIMNTSVIDASTGLDRFKSGYVVESMEDPFGLANVIAPEFLSSLNSIRGIYPRVEQTIVPLELWNAVSNSYRISNGVITLNYTEVPLAKVTTSSRVTNVNPYMVIAWNGKLTLNPPGDVWVDVVDNPTVVNTNVNYETITNWTFVPYVGSPAPEPAPAPPEPFVPVPLVDWATYGKPPPPPGCFYSAVFPGLLICSPTEEVDAEVPTFVPTPVSTPVPPVIVPVPPVIDVVGVAPPMQYGPGTSDVSFPSTTVTDGEGGEWTWHDNGMDVSLVDVDVSIDENGDWTSSDMSIYNSTSSGGDAAFNSVSNGEGGSWATWSPGQDTSSMSDA